jgi:hypothetical protein
LNIRVQNKHGENTFFLIQRNVTFLNPNSGLEVDK